MLKISSRRDNSEQVYYNIEGVPMYIGKLFVETDYDSAVECHWHDEVEFVMVTHGQLQYNINGSCITIEQGQGVFVNSKQMHHGFTVGKNICECIIVIFHPALICPNEQIENACILPVIGNNNFTHAVLSATKRGWTQRVFESLVKSHEVFEGKSSGFVLELQSLFYEVWANLYANMPELTAANSTRQPHSDYNVGALKDMIAFIHSNYSDAITLDDICAAGSVCKSKCCSLFKKYLHQTPLNYLTTHRLRLAVKLLETQSVSVNEISDSAGFGGASYFAEIFRKRYHCSPTEYREKHGRN